MGEWFGSAWKICGRPAGPYVFRVHYNTAFQKLQNMCLKSFLSSLDFSLPEKSSRFIHSPVTNPRGESGIIGLYSKEMDRSFLEIHVLPSSIIPLKREKDGLHAGPFPCLYTGGQIRKTVYSLELCKPPCIFPRPSGHNTVANQICIC